MSTRQTVDWLSVVSQAENQMKASCKTRRERRQAERDSNKIDKQRKKIINGNDDDIKYQVISQSIPTKNGEQIPPERIGNAVFCYVNMFFVRCFADISMTDIFNRLPREERSAVMKKYPNMFDLEWGFENLDDKHLRTGGHDTKSITDYVAYLSKTFSGEMSAVIIDYLNRPVINPELNFVPIMVALTSSTGDCPSGTIGCIVPGMWREGCYGVVLNEDDASRYNAHDCRGQMDWKNRGYWWRNGHVKRVLRPFPYEEFPTLKNEQDVFSIAIKYKKKYP